jgi:5-methyltetrahydrofolate--homocysteine methyltransferase
MAPVGGRVHLGPDIISAQATSPSRLAEFAQEWIDMGAQIVGGCCATGPEHIMAMNAVVRAARTRGRGQEA